MTKSNQESNLLYFADVINPTKVKVPVSKRLWKDSRGDMDHFISGLMSKMTLQEKIGQLDMQSGDHDVTGAYINGEYEQRIREGRTGAMLNAFGAEFTRKLQKIAVEESRLGIPLLIAHDIIHGHKTIFPQSLGEAASWDTDVARMGARVAAREATADGIAWTFAPMADITRDPRWGRVAEGAGEDVFLGCQMAVARVKGFQGNDLSKPDTMLATAKHFVGYGLSQAGRDYHATDVSDQELWSTQLPPFKAMLDAGVATFMTAFNDLNGTPATASKRLLTNILRDQWGFEGFVVTDYTAVNELVAHGFARDDKHAAEKAFNAGADMDMVGTSYSSYLEELVAEGKVSEKKINDSVRLILEMKWRLGLFEDPYRYSCPERAKSEILSKENLELSRDAARRSMVLLKNSNQTLPLTLTPGSLKSIALIGPMADSKANMIGNWAAAGDRLSDPVTIKEGLEARLGKEVTINYAKGATYGYIHSPDDKDSYIEVPGVCRALSSDPALEEGVQEAIEAAVKSDVIILALGEEQRMSGEASCRVELGLPGNQLTLMKELKKLGKPMILILLSGRPNDLSWEDQQIDSILHAWYPGTSGGHAVADVLLGDYNPSGKLPMTFPRSVGQVPIYYNMKSTGRPFNPHNPDKSAEHYTSRYDDSPNSPLYAFGHGLSYTKFNYGPVQLSSDVLTMDGELKVSVEVKNKGDYAGEEVVQLYTRQLVGSTTRPVKELKGFQKLHFEPGQKHKVEFTLTSEDLAFYREGLNWGAEPGEFHIFVGCASDKTQQAGFTLVE